MPFPDFEGEQVSAALKDLLSRTDIDNIRSWAQDRVHVITSAPWIDGVEVVEVHEIVAVPMKAPVSL